MARDDYDIVGSYNNQLVNEIDAERSVNLFEYIDPNAKKPKTLLPTPGLIDAEVEFKDATGGFRAQFVFNDKMYVVIGANVYSIDNTLTASKLNATPLTTSSGYVGVDANTYQVIFVDGQKGYIYDTTANAFQPITDPGFPTAPVDVCYLDGFFVVANGGTNTFQLSSFNQGLVWSTLSSTFTTNFAVNNQLTLTGGGSVATWSTGMPVTLSTGTSFSNPLNGTTTYYIIKIDATHVELATSYANAIAGTPITLTSDGTGQSFNNGGQLQLGEITSHPGTIVACKTLHRRLFLFSQYYTEVWENSGLGTNLPFRRNNSLLMEYGTPAVASIRVGFDRMFFLSQDKGGLGSVMGVVGTQALPVSPRALDQQLTQYISTPNIGVSDATGILIKQNGLIFYRLNFTAANHTYVFNVNMSDENTRRWHEEEVLNGDRHPAQTQGFFSTTDSTLNFYGDYQTPVLYVVSSLYQSNAGEAIRRMRISKPYVPKTYERLRIDKFYLDVVQGAVENPGLNEAPIIFFSWSKDGGKTYGPILPSTMGNIGEFTYQTVWRKLGTTVRGQAFVPKIEFFNKVPFVILGAAWNYEILPE